ncbi:MAG: PAS domain S-box protein [Dissulfurimicrobium sp.]|uniref:PAS domain S-box protein n=1 Tax=Dissulfurimicrobium sp. TaxID=2022436 RepID=UPI00404B6B07
MLALQGRAEALEEFRATIYSIGDGVITTDSDGRIRQMNPMAEALTGWSEADARGRAISGVFCIINEETRDRVENPVSRVFREGKVISLANHTIFISRDGVERPIADSGAPIRNQEGEVIGVVLVFSDQTESRRMQKAIRDSEETYRLLFEHAPLGLVYFNGQGVITACNDAFVKIIGSSRQVLLGLNMLHLSNKKVVEAVQDAINGRPGIYEREYHSVTADKKSFVHAIFTSIISYDGRFLGGLGIVEDVTDRKQVENLVIEERNKLAAVMDALGEGLTVQDKDFRILYQNPAHVKMQGDHLGELCYQVYHGRMRCAMAAFW